jgi:1A family penicillin-binding protein
MVNKMKNVFKCLFKSKVKRELPKKKKHFWHSFWTWTIYSVLGIILVIALLFAWFSKDLPTPSKIAGRKPTVSTKIYDKTGKMLLYETGDQKRTIVPSDQMSQYLKDATISVEDANFYQHHGIRFSSILSAVVDKMLGRTAVLRGGSTITQQYVKTALLTSDRSIARKIKEAILAVELEFMFDKDQILTMYLNEIPYGNNTAGAEAAAKMYYALPAKDLSLAQAATLAAIPNAPTYYSPYGTHVEKLVNRRNYVLDRMAENGKITKEQADEAKKVDTTTLNVAVKPRHDSMLAPHFAMYVLEQIVDEYGEDKINKEGLNIVTTLDYDKQIMAEQAVKDGVPKNDKYGAKNAALVSVDPKTGQVLAMVGSKDYFDTSIDGQVNVADSLRQPGSSFKPFAYATAFKSADYSPSKIIYDMETNFGGNPPYIPHNYNNRTNGPITMRQALSNSLNIPAVKVLSLAGIDNVLRTASDMGITTLTNRQDYGLSLVLGAGEVKPVEMAGAFSVFATGGVKHDLMSVLKITDSSNKVLYEYKPERNTGNQVLDPQIAYEMSSILSDNDARSLVFGTRSSLYFPDRTVAAKTGTTSSFKDAWTVGFTPSLATAIWVGNSNGVAMKNGADGSVLAGPIFHNYMVKALDGTPNEEFAKPAGIQTVTVERWSNKVPTQYSSETTTDIFAAWQIPTDKDNVHQVLNLCKGTDKLAPANAPAELIDTRTITVVHSERPDNPNWENPVRDWATANGMFGSAPTEICDAATLLPKISFSSPSNGTTVSGLADISVSAESPSGVKNVEYFLDGVSIGVSSTSPYSIQYDFKNLEARLYALTARITDNNNVTASTDIQVAVVLANGSTVTGVTVKDGVAGSVDISWDTTDQSYGSITYYATGVSSQTSANSSVGLTHKITLSDLVSAKTYSYTITSNSSGSNPSTYTNTFLAP